MESENSTTFPCSQCGNEYKKKFTLKRHLSTHAEKAFECLDCKKFYPQMAHLKRHQAAVHDKIKNHQCEKCNKYFSRKEHLKIHKQTVHKERQIFKRTERKGEEKKKSNFHLRFCN